MRTIFTALTLSLLTTFALADTIKDSIHSVSPGEPGEEHLLYLDNGQVVFIDPEVYSPEEFNPGEIGVFEVDENNRLESMKMLGTAKIEAIDIKEQVEPQDKTSVLRSYSEASSIFSGMNRSYYNETECTDRAHIWSYEEWKKRGLVSRKVFMFFTNTYIRRYNYGWWFHVSPYTLVEENGSIKEYVLDRRFSSSPRSMKGWSDAFIYSRKECPVTTYHNYRANNYGPEHCFHVKSHMYNRLPLHVEKEEQTGVKKDRFSSSEVNFSYRAFYQRGI